MDHQRFDAITRAMAGGASRRGVLKGLAGGALGGLVSLVGIGDTEARRCRAIGRNCRAHADCCTDHCNNDNNLYQCSCPPGLGDCNGDGLCETNTLVDVANCGACGHSCAANQPARTNVAGCAAGACTYTCQFGYGNCDGDMAGNGCETQLGTDTQCASCTDNCAARGGFCERGICFCRRTECRDCNCGLFGCDRCCSTVTVSC